jgi:hypothetical protein
VRRAVVVVRAAGNFFPLNLLRQENAAESFARKRGERGKFRGGELFPAAQDLRCDCTERVQSGEAR